MQPRRLSRAWHEDLGPPALAPGPVAGTTDTGGRSFPTGLDPFTCTRYDIADFTIAARELGVDYLGVCCGAGPHHIRAMAEALSRTPPASRYSPDMSKHAYFGTDETLKNEYLEYGSKL